MTYSHPAPPTGSVPMTITIHIHRRWKSDGNLLYMGSMAREQSQSPTPPPKNTMPQMPSPNKELTAPPSAPSTRLLRLRSEVMHQWNALADRESQSHPVYKIPFFTSLSKNNRSAIATWCYRVVDCFLVDRRIVGIALSYFDRYLCETPTRSNIGNDCWLVVIACLHIAIKLHSDKNDTAMGSALATLCCSCRLSIEEVTREERRICHALKWYLNPPMPIMYLDIVTDLILDEIATADKHSFVSRMKAGTDIVELSRFILELSVYDLYLSSERASSVAHAAILVAMNHLHTTTRVVNKWLSLALEHSTSRTDRCIPRLQSILAANCKDDVVRCTSPTSPTNVERHSV